MNPKPTHTPTPWSTHKRYNQMNVMRGHILLATVHGDSTTEPTDECRANAAHIVKCVNLHDELIKQLAIAIDIIRHQNPGNLYLEIGEMQKAICAAFGQDCKTIKTADFEDILTRAKAAK